MYFPYTIKGYISTCSIHLLIVNKKNSILGIKTAYQCMNHVHLPAQIVINYYFHFFNYQQICINFLSYFFLMKTALITGITGQDGSYLAELLLNKGYNVHGIKRRSSSINSDRIDHLFFDESIANRFHLHYGDLNDASNLLHIIQKTQPDEIYNLAAQSHVQISFETPEYTANSDGVGVLRLLEAIRILGMEKKTKFYQASTSELF